MDPSLAFMDDLLDFNSDIGEGGDEEDREAPHGKHNPNGSPDPIELNVLNSRSVPATGEEELEWISNKDAFPSVYTFVGTLTDKSGDVADLSTPVSVLENTSTSSSSNNNNNNNSTSSAVTFMSCSDDFKVPSKVRSKFLQRRRQEISSLPIWIKQAAVKNIKVETEEKANAIGKKCQHCGSEETPQWRAGPLGPKTLCNACGVRFKSGRLVPEYRPANSPTFSHQLHSNSHRKVMEMRRRKEKENSMNSVDIG